ncbi:MAG TPA: phosphatidylglycerol lysyltransferase domain-containing protein, partial [Gemmatimonadaceae bacterium]|nr:phosphatidylglycerol lysyltransferase domain-containing protein [Gemmatimonadaceae bacterium]
GLVALRRVPAIRRMTDMGGDVMTAIVPRAFALMTFISGAMLLFSGATPARSSRVGWINDILPLPVIEASAYLSNVAGIGLIILARGLQRRLDAAYHVTLWLLAAGVVFAVASALDVEQAVFLSVMFVVLLPRRRYFDRRASILEERFTRGWIIAIAAVILGAVITAVLQYGSEGLGADVLFYFGERAQGPRAQRALLIAAATLVGFGAARLLRPARPVIASTTPDDLAAVERIAATATRASVQLAFLGDKHFMFDDARTAFLMYGVAGQSWVCLGYPVGPVPASIALIEQFVTRCDAAGVWPVFYRVPPPFVHLYLEYGLDVIKLGEVARVPLQGFSLDGPKRRNLRYVMRKSTTDGCTFEMVDPGEVASMVPELRAVSDAWLADKHAREKRFSLGRFDPAFIARGPVGVVRLHGTIVAFITLWTSGGRGEVEVDLMRYNAAAPPSIMRYALTNAILWAQGDGYATFNLGAAPLSGIRASPGSSVWGQLSVLARDAGERYYNFKGIREFKEWFTPEWEPTYLVSPGGAKRPIVLANIASLSSGGLSGVFRR